MRVTKIARQLSILWVQSGLQSLLQFFLTFYPTVFMQCASFSQFLAFRFVAFVGVGEERKIINKLRASSSSSSSSSSSPTFGHTQVCSNHPRLGKFDRSIHFAQGCNLTSTHDLFGLHPKPCRVLGHMYMSIVAHIWSGTDARHPNSDRVSQPLMGHKISHRSAASRSPSDTTLPDLLWES